MGQLGFGGGVGAEHDRFVEGVGGTGDFRAGDGADNELSAGIDRVTAGFFVENCANADESLIAELGGGIADGCDGVGSGHGNFDRDEAGIDESASKGWDLLGGAGTDDRDDAGIFELFLNFGFGAHGKNNCSRTSF